MAITRGDAIRATTASGIQVNMRALGEPERGHSFEVLWVATEDEWDRAQRDGDEPDGLPWPTSAVEELTPA